MSLRIDKTNYDLYKKVYLIWWKHHFKLLYADAQSLGLNIDHLSSPVEVLNNIEIKCKPLAIKSLRAGLAEVFLIDKDAPEDFKKSVDLDLRSNNLPGYFDLVVKAKVDLKAIIKRAHLKSEEEYYFVNDYLSDTTIPINPKERSILNNCLLQFEHKG